MGTKVKVCFSTTALDIEDLQWYCYGAPSHLFAMILLQLYWDPGLYDPMLLMKNFMKMTAMHNKLHNIPDMWQGSMKECWLFKSTYTILLNTIKLRKFLMLGSFQPAFLANIPFFKNLLFHFYFQWDKTNYVSFTKISSCTPLRSVGGREIAENGRSGRAGLLLLFRYDMQNISVCIFHRQARKGQGCRTFYIPGTHFATIHHLEVTLKK